MDPGMARDAEVEEDAERGTRMSAQSVMGIHARRRSMTARGRFMRGQTGR
ncbi:MAG: hypothetical protein R3B49_10680 [Phycisphaerales bacterium]